MDRAIRFHRVAPLKHIWGRRGLANRTRESQAATSRPLDVTRSAALPPAWPLPPATVGWQGSATWGSH